MATISVILRKDKLKKDGTAPLHFLIIKDRKKTKITTGIFIDPKYWNTEKAVIKPGAENSARLNSFLKNKLAELQDKVFEHETVSKSFTSKKLKENIYGKKPTDFFSFADAAVADYEREGKIGTYDRCRSIVEKLKKFAKGPLDFQDITPEFLARYERYLRDELKNKTNSIHGNLKVFRKFFNDAVRLDIIDSQHNPFTRYKLKTEKTQRTYLTEDELAAIGAVECTPGTRIELHRDMFVFAAYCGGLRVSDVLQLKWKNVDSTHIHFTIRKTGSQLSIKVPGSALAIIEKYRPKRAEKEHYLFPMLENGLDEKDLRLVDTEISIATAYINKNLKILAGKAEIEKPISFHISRHTFATRALRKGISIDKVSKLMGHAAIRETQVYAKIVNEELDKAMDVFNEPFVEYKQAI
jgi:integrase/recombinase XerD